MRMRSPLLACIRWTLRAGSTLILSFPIGIALARTALWQLVATWLTD